MDKYYKTVVREYGKRELLKKQLHDNPIKELEIWLNEAINEQIIDANAVVLATAEAGQPDTRIVLIKEINEQGLIFYTNLNSSKAKQITKNSKVACTFYWPQLSRQVRVQGECSLVTRQQSVDYFATRSRASQASAIASYQSQNIDDKSALENEVKVLLESKKKLMCPEYWGGYIIQPYIIEFWQGRNQRLHDRFVYKKEKQRWMIQQLAP